MIMGIAEIRGIKRIENPAILSGLSMASKGQALVEAAILLSLLCFIFVLIIGLELREEYGFRAILLARRAAWDTSYEMDNPRFRIQRLSAATDLVQPSAEEEIPKQGFMRALRGGQPLGSDMVLARVLSPGLESKAEFGPEIGTIVLPPPRVECVALAMDSWDSPGTDAEIQKRAQDIMGQRLMQGRYGKVMPQK